MTAGPDPKSIAPARRIVGFLRRAWPWLVGVAILIVIASRIPLDAFRDAITRGPHLQLAAVTFAQLLANLATDSIATWVGLCTVEMRRPLSTVIAVRGATYVLYLVHYAVGQGGFGYYLHRSGASGPRAIAVTLYLMGINLATLLVATTIAWELRGSGELASLRWTLFAGCAAFALYLAAIAAAPGWLARHELLAPLFDAGLRGHGLAMIARLPHTAVMVVGYWLAIRTWGIEVPLSAGLTLMPVVAIAAVLPISPAGVGTTQAAMVYFFSVDAAGATVAERQAQVFAFATVYMVYGILASIAIGLACLPRARRLEGRAPEPASSSDGGSVAG